MMRHGYIGFKRLQEDNNYIFSPDQIGTSADNTLKGPFTHLH